MNKIFKASLLIFSLLAGITLSQNSTLPNGSMVLPLSGMRPSGSGMGLRGPSGERPQGPSNLPPANGGFSDKLANITDSKILIVKNVLQYLPPVEQDLLAGKL